MSRSLASLFGLCLLTGAASAQIGTVLRSVELDAADPAFGGRLAGGDRFGSSITSAGDLDGDGVQDLIVGAPGDRTDGAGRGALWTVFLEPSGAVKSAVRTRPSHPVFAGRLNDGAMLGEEVISVGDLDGDGRDELAATTRNPHRLWILFPDATGQPVSATEIRYSEPVFQPPMEKRDLRAPDLAFLGDTDGDGLGDLAFGMPFDDGPGRDRGALWILRLRDDGTPKSALKIGQNEGGLGQALQNRDFFGSGIVPLGDLDGDGNLDLSVRGGSPSDYFILRLDEDEFVQSFTRFSIFEYTFRVGNLGYGPAPRSLDTLGDLDGDGRNEIAVGFPFVNTAGPPMGDQGALLIGSLREDGTLGIIRQIGHQLGGLGDLPLESRFGLAVSSIGDLDGDGTTELAVGAPYDADTGVEAGSVWLLFLDGTPERNGSGVNPELLGQAAFPTLGQTWQPTLDCGGNDPGLAVLVGTDRALGGLATPFGELLVDTLDGARLFTLAQSHLGSAVDFQAPVPNDPALFGQLFHAQGLCTGDPGPVLSNALDLYVRD